MSPVLGALRRRRAGSDLALDLGTARTLLATADGELVLDEPTVVALDGSGTPTAAGWAAWQAAVDGPHKLAWPVRRARITDPVLCVQFLRLLLDRDGHDAGAVAVCVPSVAGPYDATVLAGVVSSATGAQVVPVDSVLAGAIGGGVDVSDSSPGLVCDVGAGIIEVGAVADGAVVAQAAVRVGARDYLDDPRHVTPRVVHAMRSVLQRVPDTLAGDLAARPVRLVGGGALLPGLAPSLAGSWGAPVQVCPAPRRAVVAGLSCCMRAGVAAG
ncbi:rod shape-determining protein [Motilibacter aurantiacus]|uniref:rod shape-determining protein n=1 Tax=Motilibacter aurantiacus TaxID=2714955 RepID=UPI0014098487